jgi:hypothetical protein
MGKASDALNVRVAVISRWFPDNNLYIRYRYNPRLVFNTIYTVEPYGYVFPNPRKNTMVSYPQQKV